MEEDAVEFEGGTALLGTLPLQLVALWVSWNAFVKKSQL